MTWVFKGLLGAWQGEVGVRGDYYIQVDSKEAEIRPALEHFHTADAEGGRCMREGRRPWKINAFTCLAEEFGSFSCK